MNDEDLRIDAQEERMDDRRYANRSAEEVLEDIESGFYDLYADVFDESYNKLRSMLSDYGLEICIDDIFQNVLDESTSFKSPYIDDNRSLRKRLKVMEAELGDYRFKFGLLD